MSFGSHSARPFFDNPARIASSKPLKCMETRPQIKRWQVGSVRPWPPHSIGIKSTKEDSEEHKKRCLQSGNLLSSFTDNGTSTPKPILSSNNGKGDDTSAKQPSATASKPPTTTRTPSTSSFKGEFTMVLRRPILSKASSAA